MKHGSNKPKRVLRGWVVLVLALMGLVLLGWVYNQIPCEYCTMMNNR